ncbi:chaps-domain-containing protein [Basidiobolus meristosporus CBS 931.73]|uniref:Chaps-domain-containing protein n=1 Tax=Basidiobolus meristosporus CBS 931.73 TaxID=1314790 RepID=A0A1Y1YAA7_9FUNG|nr:chaps-domain-containing protein [Basidiobolus meristosporus CBS 931.73]|eukprot:ORX94947.1 chaps-domain-containing protein [Basidiobolus meristosporus CBS 931.73]
MSETLKDVPELFENELKESLNARTDGLASYKELGPPDLCHLTKSSGKQGVKEIGSYHHILGIDASSSASLAAYINSLTYSMDDPHGWFSKGAAWKISSGVYCCYNAFSRVDVRVEVNIPGGVSSYVVNHKGEKIEARPEIWHETHISSILRSFLYSDDENYRLLGLRKIDPVSNLNAEKRFLESAEQVFFKGWQLGSDPIIQVATNIHNHLVDGLMKYFSQSSRFETAANFFEKLYTRDPEVTALLARAYFGMDEEIKGVKALHQALKKNSMSYPLLHVQADFLLKKKKMETALQLAKQAVNSAPSEFITWAKLTEIYIDMDDFKSALLTLNSCPMFTYTDRDFPRMPQPMKVHLPARFEGNFGLGPEEDSEKESEVQSALARLPAPSLRGTFAVAYNILTLLVSKVGWDELLRCRSNVFVMEEEYRLQKAQEEQVHEPEGEDENEDDNTPLGVIQKQSSKEEEVPVENEEVEEKANVQPTPDSQLEKLDEQALETVPEVTPTNITPSDLVTEEVSTHNEESEEKEIDTKEDSVADQMESISLNDTLTDALPNQKKGDEPEVKKSLETTSIEKEKAETDGTTAEDMAVEKKSIESATTRVENIPPSMSARKDSNQSEKTEQDRREFITNFSNKRLCERWLDNLFMVLYEDLRAYTAWRAEASHIKAQHLTYSKTGAEWETLGDLGLRLHHKEEAKEAYQRCLHNKFSAKAWLKLMKIYADEDNLQQALTAIVQLSVHNDRWYNDVVYPSPVADVLNHLIKNHGLSKVQNVLISMNLPAPVYKIVTRYFAHAELFKIDGSEW